MGAGGSPTATSSVPATASSSSRTSPGMSQTATNDPKRPLLTVTGYIINRERIELSPRFLGVVRWIGVRKGDVVTNGQIVVRLDDEVDVDFDLVFVIEG